MHCFRYKLNHDFGLAPNPFGGIMTLAVCKGDIRRHKNLAVGDWIIGTGSKRIGLLNRLIYAMKVDGNTKVGAIINRNNIFIAIICSHTYAYIYIVTTRRIKYPKTNNKKQNTKPIRK